MYVAYHEIMASSRENLSSGGCEQQRRGPACASAQSGQRLSYSLAGKDGGQTCPMQSFNILERLCN